MTSKKKSKIIILDTSAVLSGKPIVFDDVQVITTPGVSNELQPGGKDYQNFQFLIEKGLTINTPSKRSIDEINKVSTKTGDADRLSSTDVEILALALDLDKTADNEPVILTDDYSIQNIADFLKIKFESISQRGIKKRFKWVYRCRGCGRRFEENLKICPICGDETRNIVSRKTNIKKRDM